MYEKSKDRLVSCISKIQVSKIGKKTKNQN